MNLRKFLIETIRIYRREFEKLSPDVKERIRKESFDDTLLKPCQIEVLDSLGEVGCFVIHNKDLDDMDIKIRKNSKTYGDSEFVKKYHFGQFEEFMGPNEMLIKDEKWLVFWTRNAFYPNFSYEEPEIHAINMLRKLKATASENIRIEKVDTIRQSASDLRESIAKLPESGIQSELTEHAKMLEKALEEIKRIDKDIGGVRQLMGTSKEYQDWRLLVSDVHRLKGEHVSQKAFQGKIDELNTRINSLYTIKEAYDKIVIQQTEFMKQQAEVMKQQSSFIKWIKYATILLPIAVVSVPVIEIISVLVRHSLGIL